MVPGKADGHRKLSRILATALKNPGSHERSRPGSLTRMRGEPTPRLLAQSLAQRGDIQRQLPDHIASAPADDPFLAPLSLPVSPQHPSHQRPSHPFIFANPMSPRSVALPESSNSPNWKNSLNLCPSKLIISASRGAWTLSGRSLHPGL